MSTKTSSQLILNSLQSLSEPIHVQGASPSLAAYIISKWLNQDPKQLLCLAPDFDQAKQLSRDIRSFLYSMNAQDHIECDLVPFFDQSPYGGIYPSIRLLFDRAHLLSKLAFDGQKARILVGTPLALSQKTIPKSLFLEVCTKLRVGDEVSSLSSICEQLHRMGYRSADIVEDPGTYSLRGEILDIFPLSLYRAIRIEFFDVQIEKIRFFDPSTQRTLSASKDSTLNEILISPAKEAFLDPAKLSSVKNRIKAYCDQNSIPKQLRDQLFESMDLGVPPEHFETWIPFLYEQPETFYSYLLDSKKSDDDLKTIIFDELSCEQSTDTDYQSLCEDFESLDSNQTLTCPPSLLFDNPSKSFVTFQSDATLYFDQVDLRLDDSLLDTNRDAEESSNSPKTKHVIFSKKNSDLKASPFEKIKDLLDQYEVHLFANTSSQIDRIKHFIHQRELPLGQGLGRDIGQIKVHQGVISEGFRWPADQVAFVSDDEIFQKKTRRSRETKASNSASSETSFQNLSDLQEGNFVVHKHHGIGKYQGIELIKVDGSENEFLLIEYASKDKLYLPVYKLDQIQKYLGSGKSVTLDKLGSQRFEKAKGKVKDQVRQLAFSLVELYAQRELQNGAQFNVNTESFEEMESKFPFDETPDQIKAIDETLTDLSSGKVMDRLICGDVGFGKTEVAMRAAYAAILNGKQVAVLVPTTVLAIQHEQTFKNRLSKLGVEIESLSRLKKSKAQKEVFNRIKKGEIDIIVGTHRLLSSSVEFKDLGLIVVDEEHRFGVEHKEKLKTLKLNTHVLTLTATPIPRTLHMSLSGLRDITLITTPPIDRLPIRTYVSKYDDDVIKKAIEFELGRGGQVFFLHNRVDSIEQMANHIQSIVPSAKITIAHGQMTEAQLEKQILKFYSKEANVLVCTTIIESGLDIPSANTIIMNRADHLGLAQLYQLRGRVGRSDQRAFAYLLISSSGQLTDDAKKRLDVIQRFVELGSGFQIASHDLEIRGGGNLLGPEQSGQIAAVGFDLYTELLQEAIEEVKSGKQAAKIHLKEPEIKTPFSCYLDQDYVPGIQQKLSFYRRLSNAKETEELHQIEEEIEDRYGKPSESAENLFWMIRLKILLRRLQIESLTAGKERISLLGGDQAKLNPQKIIQVAMASPDQLKVYSNSKIVFFHRYQSMKEIVLYMEEQLAKMTDSLDASGK